jgi:hypothetical protein
MTVTRLFHDGYYMSVTYLVQVVMIVMLPLPLHHRYYHLVYDSVSKGYQCVQKPYTA